MKITKLSLAAIAAVAMTTGAMAEVTTELSGNAKLFYETQENDTAGADSLFNQSTASGQALVSVEAKGKAGVLGYGLKYTAVDTLGLESNVVSGVRVLGTGADSLNTAHWAEKAFITYGMGNTTAKIGRQHLDTPLAFSEDWNIATNSFDAAVLINSDIENVTLIGAYVGRGNGTKGRVVAQNGEFDEFGANSYATPLGDVALAGSGAYAAAALVKPMADLGLNLWYYNVQNIADAAWIDANYAVNGINLGALYAQMMPTGQIKTYTDTTAYAVKAGTTVGGVSLLGAYSSVDADNGKNVLPVANVATGFKKTKLPTAGVYNDGLIVAMPGSDAFKLQAGMPVGPVSLTAAYISSTNDTYKQFEANEFDVIVGTKIADVNVKAMYFNRDFGETAYTDHQNVRIIAGIDF
ncbi:porin [bacterium]|nr:porin [bacterium]MBU1958115.1 porin [bacterium]